MLMNDYFKKLIKQDNQRNKRKKEKDYDEEI